jgi:hypothetical protein
MPDIFKVKDLNVPNDKADQNKIKNKKEESDDENTDV